MGFHLAEAEDGRAVFEGMPDFVTTTRSAPCTAALPRRCSTRALGCAIFSTTAKGDTWTTLELKINLVRPMNKDTGPVRAEGRIMHRGRTVATSEGDLKDRAGKLYAHATTTCMIFPAKDVDGSVVVVGGERRPQARAAASCARVAARYARRASGRRVKSQ